MLTKTIALAALCFGAISTVAGPSRATDEGIDLSSAMSLAGDDSGLQRRDCAQGTKWCHAACIPNSGKCCGPVGDKGEYVLAYL